MKLPSLVGLLLPGAVAGLAVPAPAPQSKPAAPANPPAAAPSSAEITGTVVDTMESGGYTYLKLKTASGEVWAAVNKADVKKGSTATVGNAMLMENFESKTLNRKFDKIYFGTLGSAGAGAGSAPAAGAMPPGHPAVGGQDAGAAVAAQHAAAAQGPTDVGPIKVSKASGANGRTVAEIYAQKTALKDKPVVLHGKVVKFLPEIMGKNWIHVRDGSGSVADKNDDMTVTTKDTFAVGDVVTVTGTVRLDKNFGAGYAYPVIIEDAKVTK